MQDQFDIDYFKTIMRKRKWLMFFVSSFIFTAGLLVAFLLPPIFRSEVGILVEGQQIPENYVQSTITSYVDERIGTITQQVMGRSKLLEIINKHNLYPNLESEGEMISEIRKNIKLETMTANLGKGNRATIGFKLYFSGRNPEKLQAVANELAYLYLEEEMRAKEKLASVTTDFLRQELNNFKQHIDYMDNRISEFKTAHIGRLPENYTGNVQALSRLERQLDQIEPNIRSLEERKLYLKTQIANIEPLTPIMIDGKNVMMNPAERLKRLRLQLLSMKTSYSEKHPDIIKLKSEIKELEEKVGEENASVEKVKRLNDLQGKIAAMKGRLGEKHPDVVKMQKEYDALSKEVENIMTVLISSEVEETKPDNPLYINLMTQIVTIESKIKGLLEEKKKIKKELRKYYELIENAPLVEKEYNDLVMDRSTAMRKYNDLLAKLMQAQVAEGMEASQKGERFTISEPASYPHKPHKPNRLMIVMLSFVVAVGASIALVAFLEGMDVSVKTDAQISSMTGLPVFSVLPFIKTEEEIKAQKRRKFIYVFIVIGSCLGFIVAFHTVFMPIDVLWSKVINRLIIIGVPIDAIVGKS